MKKNKNSFTLRKITKQEYLDVYKGVKMPWNVLTWYVVVMLVFTVCNLYIAGFNGQLVDEAGNISTGQLVTYVVVYFVANMLAAAANVINNIAAERINLGVRGKLWNKIIRIKQTYYDKEGGERLVTRVTNDCAHASTFYTSIISSGTNVFTFLLYFLMMFSINATMALSITAIVPLGALVTWFCTKLQSYVTQKTQMMLSNATSYLIERTSDLKLVKACGAEEEESASGKVHFQTMYEAEIQQGLATELWIQLTTLMGMIAILIPFGVGAVLVAQGVLTPGEVVTVYTTSASVAVYYLNIGAMIMNIVASANGLAEVSHALKAPEEDPAAGIPVDEADEDLVFENVAFAYDEAPVLKNITCRIPKGKTTAIIGTNGSGKTTMFKLLGRLYEPMEGRLCFGETDAATYNLADWRRSVSIVAQGSPILAGTVRDNITYGCRRAVTEEEILEVAKQARVYDFVKDLPEGLDTEVIPGGMNFSGGQRQCIAIARAMMNNPDYLLLDEATCNLDAKSEAVVTQALQKLMEGRTTVIIAHSLSAIRDADHVIVLKDGTVETSGAPADILKETDNYLLRVMNRRKAAANEV